MPRHKNEEFAEEEEEFRRALDAVPPPTPPDGGWGWVIVFSSFFMNVIVDGVCYSYGILLPHLIEAFDSSLTVMSLGGAVLLSTYMMSGTYSCPPFDIALRQCGLHTLPREQLIGYFPEHSKPNIIESTIITYLLKLKHGVVFTSFCANILSEKPDTSK